MKRGNKLWKRVLTAALSLAVAGACLPFGALAEATVEGGIAVDKTATALDADNMSEVTLSVDGDSEKTVSDVVFVLDKSTSSNVKEDALKMLTELKSLVGENRIKVGLVIFNIGVEDFSQPLGELTDEQYQKIYDLMNEEEYGNGTNISEGIAAGLRMLDEDSSVDASAKHLVLVTDGVSYLWGWDSEDDKPYTIYNAFKHDDGWIGIWTSHEIINATGSAKPFKIQNAEYVETFGNAKTWMETNRTSIEALITDYQTTYDPKVTGTGANAKNFYKNGEYGVGEPVKPYIPIPEENSTQYISSDAAIYMIGKTWESANENYHLYAYASEKYITQYPWASAFISSLSTISGTSAMVPENVSGMFDDVKSDILYKIGAGSYVTDVIGQDFDFVPDASTITMTADGETYFAEELYEDENGIAFGFGKTEGETEVENTYKFILSYHPATAETSEQFNWTFSVPVLTASLTYKVQLVNISTEAGTYVVPTNESATLQPSRGTSIVFPQPTVSYTVEAQPTPTPADPTPAPTPKDEHPEIAQAIKDGTWGKADPTPTPSAAPAAKVTSTHIPQTGDTSNPVLWVVVMVMALAAFADVVILRRRNNKD